MICKQTVLRYNVRYIGLIEGQVDMYQPSFADFITWVESVIEVQFDVETNVTNRVRERELKTVQFGSVNETVPVQWVFQWSYLSKEQKEYIKKILESRRWTKLIHNAAFEIMVCLNYGIRLRGVYDTMICEQVILCGYDKKHGIEYGLDDVSMRRLFVYMDKSDQTSFGDDFITHQKIKYAAGDVIVLDKIKNLQLLDLHLYNLEFTAALENEAIHGLAQMQWEGLKLDKEKWLENLEWAMPELQKAEDKLNRLLEEEPFRSVAIRGGYMGNQDAIHINWKSNPQKREIFAYLFPDCPGTTKAILKKYILKLQDQSFAEMIWETSEGNFTPLEQYLITHHRQWLIDHEMLIPAGTSTMNWNSPAQVLPMLQAVHPRAQDTSAETLGRIAHPISTDLEAYRERLKLTNDYGEDYFKYLDPDGCVRTRFNPIATTGRLKSSNPNMQNVTVKEFVGQRYRNCFKVPYDDFVFVSGDYVSQELGVIAYITNDRNWIEAIKKGQDVHSIASELVYRDRKNHHKMSWQEAAEPGCAYYAVVEEKGKKVFAKQKCKCKKHQVMRYDCKTINFMLAYGGTEFRLASELRIALKDAKALILDYYKAMPAIGKIMTYLGHFGVKYGYIMTLAPFYRRRWFPIWSEKARFIEEHLAEVRIDKDLAKIEKEAKNQPIQGSSADQVKVAICMVMWELDENNLHDKVKLLMQVHDQLDTGTHKNYADTWKVQFKTIMEEAALVNIPTGLLKADVTVTEVWSK